MMPTKVTRSAADVVKWSVLAAARLEKGKNVRSLSPQSGALRRIDAVVYREWARARISDLHAKLQSGP